VKLVVFDWAGTIVDHGCFAPVAPFVEAFARHGVELSTEVARGPMGLEKKDHIRALLALPEVARGWQRAHAAAPSEADVERIFADFVPLQLARVDASSRLISGLLECVEELRRRGVAIATTTGYFAEAADLCYAAAAEQGFRPDAAFCPSDVPEGRPAPWMIFRAMEALRVHPPAAVVKVGDTAPDIGEAVNAGAWAVGVAATGSHVGLTEDELAALPADDRERRIVGARRMVLGAGAHYVIGSVRDVPALVAQIDARLARGGVPSAPQRVPA